MTVRVTALRPFFGTYGKVKQGDEIEVSDAHARHYERKGMVVPVVGGKMQAKPQNKMEAAPANKASADPSSSRRTGGRTGEDEQQSSSRVARQPVKRESSKRKAARES